MNEKKQNSIDEACLDIYRETAEFPPIRDLLGDQFGFEILMGRPFFRPPVLILGYQPGDWALSPTDARLAGYESHWVKTEKSQYATEQWLLAKRLREIFSEDLSPYLEKSVGLNAIFVRSKSIATYEKSIDLENRRKIQKFCFEQNKKIIDMIEPKKIMIIGFRAAELFGKNTTENIDSNEKALTKKVDVFGRKALVVRHITGSRISTPDRQEMKQIIRQFVVSPD